MICIIIGTRPEIIKMAPLIRACKKKNLQYFILHTGQHYSYELDKKLFEDLELEEPKYNLNVGSREYRKQLGMMIREIMQVLIKEKPEIVFVQGDTNSVLAASLAANKLKIAVGHHEAGLRSHDITMLEETNRIITDHISDILFAPTKQALANLKDEGIDMKKAFLTGNTIVDAAMQNITIAKKKTKIISKLGLKEKNYILATSHRAENVDNKTRLKGIMHGLELAAEELNAKVIFPIHPRTKAKLKEFKIKFSTEKIRLIKPLGYLDFLMLISNAKLIITDSGGIQEEACILRVPCITIRDSTERPETLKKGVNMLAGTNSKDIAEYSKKIISDTKKLREWPEPFGDGKAGERIISLWIKNKKKVLE